MGLFRLAYMHGRPWWAGLVRTNLASSISHGVRGGLVASAPSCQIASLKSYNAFASHAFRCLRASVHVLELVFPSSPVQEQGCSMNAVISNCLSVPHSISPTILNFTL
jgi:hypothetical protein